jgi:hypothetical protein
VSLGGANTGVGVARVLVLLVSLLGSGELFVARAEIAKTRNSSEGRDTRRNGGAIVSKVEQTMELRGQTLTRLAMLRSSVESSALWLFSLPSSKRGPPCGAW